MMNKNLFLIVAFLSLINMGVNAQERFRIGLKGGINYSNYSGNFEGVDASTSGEISFHSGVMAEIQVLNKFAIQPEVLYDVEKFEISNLDSGLDTKFKIDFISIPVLLKYELLDNVKVMVGPEFSFVLDHERDLIRNGSYDSNALDQIKDRTSVALGLEYEVQDFILYGRYKFGVSEVYENDRVDLKSSSLYIGLGYFF